MEYLQVCDFVNATFQNNIYGILITEVFNNQTSTDVRRRNYQFSDQLNYMWEELKVNIVNFESTYYLYFIYKSNPPFEECTVKYFLWFSSVLYLKLYFFYL